jgi:hypothetical protein
VGRIERTLFIVEWILDAGAAPCTVGTSTAEHHAAEKCTAHRPSGRNPRPHDGGQHYRIAGLNLLTAIIV